MPAPLHGWIVIDKPVGPGSTACVGAVKRALREGGYPRVKVGHGGTLDPLASGVLPIALGEATKLAGRMLESDKVYAFTVSFGIETDTLDAEGAAIAASDTRPTPSAVAEVVRRFTGAIEQVPPVYSAIKVDGARAYDRARAGETLAMRTRAVTIHSLVLDGATPDAVTFVAHVSKGTYIRSLARDIARALGTVGHVTMLRRRVAGPFNLDQAISLDKMADLAKAHALEDVILPLTAGLDDIPALSVTPDEATALREGRKLIGRHAHQGLMLAVHGLVPVALVEVSGPEIRVVRGFNLANDVAKDA